MLKHQLVRLLIVFVGIGIGFYSYKQGHWVYLVLLLLTWSLILAWGSFDIRLGYFTKTRCSNPKIKDLRVALTFDDGPTEFTNQALDILKENQVKATFFCIGKQIEKHPEIFNRIIAEDHLVGNHSYSHSTKFGFLKTDQVIEEIQKTDQLIFEGTGEKSLLFRPPFGVTNPNIHRAIQKTEHHVIGWSIRSLDTATEDEAKILKRIERKLHPGGIILMHDTTQKSINVLDNLLKSLSEKKYAIVPADELLEIEAYRSKD